MFRAGMKSVAVVFFLLTLASSALELPKNHLVSPEWLAKHMGEKGLVIVDTRKAETYRKGHIPGAVNLPKALWFQGKMGSVPKLYNGPEEMNALLQKAGIDSKSAVVFYSAGTVNKDFADAASALWSLWIYGLRNTALLDGGFGHWTHKGGAVSHKIPKVQTSDYEVERFDDGAVAALPQILRAIYDEKIQISDARVSKFYLGEDKRKDLARHGRIPTARLTPMIRQVKKEGSFYRLLDPKEAKSTLNNNGFGVETDRPLIIYCNTGHKARGLWFVARFIVGMKEVSVYDGSMVEYSRTTLPVEEGEPMD